jgi:hypothetical protein
MLSAAQNAVLQDRRTSRSECIHSFTLRYSIERRLFLWLLNKKNSMSVWIHFDY